RAPEPALEIQDAPADLRSLVARVGERQNHVAVRLRDRGAVTGEPFPALAIRREDRLINRPRLPLEPGQQSRAEVEAHARVVARLGVGRITLGRDALVPVV